MHLLLTLLTLVHFLLCKYSQTHSLCRIPWIPNTHTYKKVKT